MRIDKEICRLYSVICVVQIPTKNLRGKSKGRAGTSVKVHRFGVRGKEASANQTKCKTRYESGGQRRGLV